MRSLSNLHPVRAILLLFTVISALSGRSQAAGIDYATTIQPIYTALCISCHGNTKTDGGLNLQTNSYTNTVNVAGNRTYSSYRVRPNFATNALSAIYAVVVSQGNSANHNGGSWSATATQKTNITQWIQQGALPDLSTPTVTSVSATSGTSAGGTSVTINGTKFGGSGTYVPTVTFGGVAATSVVVTTGSFIRITCTTPPHAAGAVDVVVTTTAGGASNTLANGFTFIGPPSVASPTSTAITATSATLGGNATADGGATISTRGVVFATTSLNAAPAIGGANVTNVAAAAGGTGTFTISATGLTSGTSYSYAAYATNTQGTSYSSVGTFSTLSVNNKLASLAPSVGSIAFDSNVNDYTLTVPYTADAITLTPTVQDVASTIQINGSPVASGSPSSAINLSVGSNTLTTIVTAQDSTTRTYTITVTRTAVDTNNNLTSLVPQFGNFTTAFNSSVLSYTLNVVNAVDSLTFTPTTASTFATVEVNGGAVSSGIASNAISLTVGNNPVSVVVTAQDNSTRTFSIDVVRAAATSSSALSSLVPSIGDLSPTFNFATHAYTLVVPQETTSFTLTPTLVASIASLEINGSPATNAVASSDLALNIGSNTINVAVTSQDLTSTTTYVITVQRIASSNAKLASLTTTLGTLSPAFDSNTTSYTVDLENTNTSLSVTPIFANAFATMTVNGSALASAATSAPVSLVEGDNSIAIIVTAQDGTTTKTYNINAHRAFSGAPRIVTQPASQTVLPAANVTFSVLAVGADSVLSPITYQWRKGTAVLAGQTTNSLTLTNVAATNAGAYSVIVKNALGTVTSDTATLTIASPTAVGLPQIMAQPIASLVELGRPATFEATASGATALTLQWRKNPSAAALATSISASSPAGSNFPIQVTTLKSAGSYSLLAKNSAGSVASVGARLGVVSKAESTVLAKASTLVKLTVSAAGEGLIYRWKKNGEEISDSTVDTHIVTGTNTASLSIKGSVPTDSGDYTCLVRLGNRTLEGGKNTLKVYSQLPNILLTDNTALPPGIVSGTYDDGADHPVSIPIDQSSDRAVVTFSAKTLPAGLKIDPKTGVIYGKPTVSSPVGTPFSFTVTATNSIGSDSVKLTLAIEALQSKAIGTFNGLIARDARNGVGYTKGLSLNAAKTASFGGSIYLIVDPKGVFSGKVTLGANSYPFTKQVLDSVIGGNPTATVHLTNKLPPTSVTLTFGINKDTGEFTPASSISDGDASPVNVQAWRQETPALALQGTFNAALDFESTQVPDPNGDITYPQGNGFGALTISAKGAAWKGKLADGTVLTFTTTVSSDGTFPVHTMLYGNTGSVHGTLQITADNVASPTNAGLPLVDGTIDWCKAKQLDTSKVYNYKTGFELHSLTVAGGKYNTPTSIILGLTDPGLGNTNAKITFTEGGLLGPSPIIAATQATDLNATRFRITSANVLIEPLSTVNPASLKPTFAVKTGAIGGSFILSNDQDPTSIANKPLKRTGKFEGLLITRLSVNRGVGYFLLSKLPELGTPNTTLATSPIYSGQLVLEPK